MARGWRLTISRSERFLGSYGYGNSQDTASTDIPELGEEDIWSMIDDVADQDDPVQNNSQSEWSRGAGLESNNGSLSTRSRRRIPRDDHRSEGGFSLAFEDSSGNKTRSSRIVHQFRGHDSVVPPARHMATSAPVNVPDWGKILRMNSVESLHDSDEEYDDCESEMIPPHEYLAREYARSRKMGGASVFEGVGRTLKGRDLSRVRDAVWRQTGFDG